jgi:hypothetical protein
MPVRDRHLGLAVERNAAGQQLVRDDAEGVQVRPRVGRLTLQLLRRQVLHGSRDRAGLRRSAVCVRAREPEVGYLRDPLRGEHDVLGLHVPVHDPLAMRVVERGQDLQHDFGGRARGEQALRVQHVAQALAAHVLHHHEVHPVDGPPVVDVDDVRVVETGRRARFAPEPFDEPRVSRERRVKDLDRDLALEHRVAGAVHLAHPAGGDQPQHVIAPVEGGGRGLRNAEGAVDTCAAGRATTSRGGLAGAVRVRRTW